MEQDDDPEKRIAELERLRAQASAGRAVDQPAAYRPAPQSSWPQQPQGWQRPAGPSGYGPPPVPRPLPSRRPRGRFRAVFSTIVLGIMAVGFAGLAGHSLYAYGVGAPTKATVVSCHYSGKSRSCTGTWAIDGERRSGKIDGNGKNYEVGSTMDVRVHDGTAYTKRSVLGWLWPAALFVGVGALGLFLRMRRRRRSS